ncbi:gibberellin 2-oxidase protein [Dioscorea alata]|uniref:Gibberellin 2-oxidase protein n=1 Tax=Dioscorea alata TaxID=55571 RepID=A0ACB7VV02_DIOAL|nr:gibberellin 2-oxidase protein [Dioscorea alata]
MVVARSLDIPVIDLLSSSWKSGRREQLVSKEIVKASEKYGIFKVVNHGVRMDVVERMEEKGMEFFSLPENEKHKAGPPNPIGYGVRSIGFNGDMGDLEYLLLHTNPSSLAHKAKTICKSNPNSFSHVVNEYVEEVRDLACQILDMLALGLGLGNYQELSRLLRDSENDSLLRLNYYPTSYNVTFKDKNPNLGSSRVGFGEHSDPQLLTVLRSNNVSGLQIVTDSFNGETWVSIPPDPTAFYIIIGDVLQAMTNGRLKSVRHRVITNPQSSRLSMMYFGAPPLHAVIRPLPEMVSPECPRKYRAFTWGEFKKAMYSLRLGYNRLDLYRLDHNSQ